MKKRSRRSQRRPFILIALFFILVGLLSSIFIFNSNFPTRLKEGWKALTRESKRILGWGEGEVSQEERRIREEVILKKMEKASADQDWRTFAPEYPRPKKNESSTAEERMKALKNTTEFKEMDKEFKAYLEKKEDLFYPDPPIPSLKDATDLISLKDKGTEKVIERLQSARKGNLQENALEENILLGMKGPLLTRKILERPKPPQVKVRMEAEIELTIYVLPNGTVDRVVPSVKGDTELERVAIQYLKQWRFAPVPKEQAQVEQWGTIPIKFKLQ